MRRLHKALSKSKEAISVDNQVKASLFLRDLENEGISVDQIVVRLLDALTSYMGMNDEKSMIEQARICHMLGTIYREQCRLQEALDFFDRGMELVQKAIDQNASAKLIYEKARSYRRKRKLVTIMNYSYKRLRWFSWMIRRKRMKVQN